MSLCECKTLKGKRCSRAAKYDNYCWQHKKCKNPINHTKINEGEEVIGGKVIWQPAVVINDTRTKRRLVTDKMMSEINNVTKKLGGYYAGIASSSYEKNGSTNIRMQVLDKSNITTITKALVQVFGGVYNKKLLKKEEHPYMPDQYRYIISD